MQKLDALKLDELATAIRLVARATMDDIDAVIQQDPDDLSLELDEIRNKLTVFAESVPGPDDFLLGHQTPLSLLLNGFKVPGNKVHTRMETNLAFMRRSGNPTPNIGELVLVLFKDGFLDFEFAMNDARFSSYKVDALSGKNKTAMAFEQFLIASKIMDVSGKRLISLPENIDLEFTEQEQELFTLADVYIQSISKLDYPGDKYGRRQTIQGTRLNARRIIENGLIRLSEVNGGLVPTKGQLIAYLFQNGELDSMCFEKAHGGGLSCTDYGAVFRKFLVHAGIMDESGKLM